MIFRKAEKQDLEAVFALYRSVVGTPCCVWNDDYPGWPEIHEDFENGTLYVVSREEAILGAISIVVKNELDELTFWQQRSTSGSMQSSRLMPMVMVRMSRCWDSIMSMVRRMS